MARNTTGPRNLSLRERRQAAVRLRKEGLTYAAISERLGYANRAAARNAILMEMNAHSREDVQELRQQEQEKLAEAEQAIWGTVQAGDLEAVRTWLSIAGRRARLLGLDAPTKVEVKPEARLLVLQLGPGKPPRVIDLSDPDYSILTDEELSVLEALGPLLEHQGAVAALPEPQEPQD